MCINKTFIPPEHGHHGDTFGGGEGQVVAGTMLITAILHAA